MKENKTKIEEIIIFTFSILLKVKIGIKNNSKGYKFLNEIT